MDFTPDSFDTKLYGGKKAVQVVKDFIKSLIEQKKIRKGDKIPTESELCQLLNIGRGSVREAVKLLEAINVLEIRRGDGTYVADIQNSAVLEALYYKIILDDISTEELIDYRVQIEIAIIQLAIRKAEKNDIDRLRQSYIVFEKYIKGDDIKDPNTLRDMDITFHKILGKCAKNQLLEEIYLLSLNIFSPLIMRDYQSGKIYKDAEETLRTHEQICKAIEKRDANLAIAAVIESNILWEKWINIE